MIETTKEEVIKSLNKGYSAKEVAELYTVTITEVNNIIKKCNYVRPSYLPNSMKKLKTEERILEMFNKGYCFTLIKHRLRDEGFPKDGKTIRNVLDDYDLSFEEIEIEIKNKILKSKEYKTETEGYAKSAKELYVQKKFERIAFDNLQAYKNMVPSEKNRTVLKAVELYKEGVGIEDISYHFYQEGIIVLWDTLNANLKKKIYRRKQHTQTHN